MYGTGEDRCAGGRLETDEPAGHGAGEEEVASAQNAVPAGVLLQAEDAEVHHRRDQHRHLGGTTRTRTCSGSLTNVYSSFDVAVA